MRRQTLMCMVLGLVMSCGPGTGPTPPVVEGTEDEVETPELEWVEEPMEPVLIGSKVDDREERIEFPVKDATEPLAVIVDTPYQIWTNAGTYIHVGVWDENFEPAQGARIFVDDEEMGTANEHGTFVFQYIPNKDGGGSGHMLTALLDRGGKRYMGSVSFSAGRRTESFESANIFVYTDRGVYNPGQTIRVRALAWKLRGEFKPLAHGEVEILLVNEKGRVVGGGGTETDEWGILSMDIPLPDHAPEGRYTLQANFERESAEAKIRIERFVPPVIEIVHDLGRFLTRDQKTLPFSVELGYFAGGEFEKGQMKITATALGKQVFSTKKQVEGEGPFEVEIGQEDLNKIRNGLYENDIVQFEIEVTDQHGRTDSVKRDMRFVTNPYVAIIIPDKEAYGEGDPVLVTVRIKDLDHVPVRDQKVKVLIEGETYFETTDEDGVAEFRTQMANHSMYVEAYMEGVDHAVATSYLNFRYTPPMLSEIPGGKVGEREMTKIVVNFSDEYLPAEQVVHADVTDSSGSIMYAFEIPVSEDDGQYRAETEFPAPSWGSMLITLYCIAKRKGDTTVGLLADGQKLEVAPRKTIQIELDGIPDVAKPGETIEVSASVRNAQGQRIDASVGASIVDDAVISMLDPLEITPMDRFYNPELKVMSTTGATTLTWPVVSRNWGSAQYDIAWCNWGWRDGGGVNPPAGFGGSGNYGGGGDMPTSGAGPMGGGMDDYAMAPYEEAPMLEQAMEPMGPPPAAAATPAPVPPPKSSAKPSKKKSMMTKSKVDFADSAILGTLSAPADMEADMGVMAAKEAQEKKPVVNITIRTNFAETSLWDAHMLAEKGKLSFSATLPDSITVQKLTLVASDKVGGSGVKHHEIQVSQDLYARSDLPATLTMGDALQVQAAFRNDTDEKVKATLHLDSEILQVVGKSKVKVQAKPGGTAVARFTVRPRKAGKALYTISATGKGFKDVEERSVYVRPSGTPTRKVDKGLLEGGKKYKTQVELSGKETYHTSFLSVSFPTAIPALQGLEAMLDKPAGAFDFVASRALVAASVYRYMQSYGKDEKALTHVGQIVQLSLAAVLMSQRDDGGWGWNVNMLRLDDTGNLKKEISTTNPYMTAQALEALLEMKLAGLPVPQDAVTRALDNLASTVNSDGYWDMASIAVWEGTSDRVQVGMSAEIWKVMAHASVAFPGATGSSSQYATAMNKMRPVYEAYLEEKKTEPFALANAALGLFYDAKKSGGPDKKLTKKLEAAADRLLTMRDEAHWEPGWFNAWGGTIEATEAAMELMIRHDPVKYELELRRALQYILSTQTSFGDWHNARGTASAVRALLLVPPTKPEKASTVTILVNGEEVKQVEIDPDAPFLSAVNLRMVELTDHMEKGKNSIVVKYDGNLEAPVSVITETWTGKTVAQLDAQSPDVTMLRTYASDSVARNEPVQVRLKGVIESKRMPLVITEPIPSCATVESASLDQLVADGLITDWIHMGDSIQLYVAPTKKTLDLVYRITGTHEGKCVQAPTEVFTVFDIHASTFGSSTRIEVD